MGKEPMMVNREYKDRLFKLIFREKKDVLNLYEHQSTFSPNLPLRGLLYFSDLYRKMIGSNRDIYSSKQILLSYPQFVVFYNGTKEEPERQVLHLHEAFPKGSSWKDAALDCHAVILNINMGQNAEIMRKCRKLKEYAAFIERVRAYMKEKKDIRQAIDLAVDECIREGILADILRDNREEVCSMLLTEYDEQAHIESEREIAKEEGQERMSRLIVLLTEKGRQGEILKAATDEKYREQLFEEFAL